MFSQWLRRLWYLVNRRRLERQLQNEMDAHREMMGEPVRFGNTLRLREESRDVWGWNWLDAVCQDLRCAFSSLLRARGFTAAALVILSLGIGLNLSVFQVVNRVFMRPLPVKDLPTLVAFDRRSANTSGESVPYPAVRK
jgi:hypothetical protein